MKQWVGLLCRAVLAAVWLSAGVLKFSDAAGTVRATRAFRLLPESLVPAVGHLLPVLELVIGACLLLGLLTRAMAVATALLMVLFTFGIASAWARGLEIQCGCFGGGGNVKIDATPGYIRDILRDLGLLMLSAWLVWRPRTWLSLDSLLFRPLERFEDVDEEQAAVQG
ncbi:MAG: hypothetical protein QOH37_1601 [Nocardioidaceae bacterium]|nr:hypothetical protein [Nocardioidaceae bacterium]